jgi:phosphatidylinositol glycan class K
MPARDDDGWGGCRFNYRHTANALAVYAAVKRLGVDDAHVLLLLAEHSASDARNVFPGRLYAEAAHARDLMGAVQRGRFEAPEPLWVLMACMARSAAGAVEVDYQGADVNAEAFLRLLTGVCLCV